MTATPWMKFYPSDWRADPALRMCCLAARGLWMEMLSIMHEAEPRGHLLVRGKAVTDLQLANLAGATEEEVAKLIEELEAAGVFSRKKNGVMFSRRMEKDENKSRKNRENGRMGGNPALCKDDEILVSDNHEVKAHGSIPEARSQIPEKKVETANAVSCANGQSDETFVFQGVVRSWNLLADENKLPAIQHLTGPRKIALRLRLKELGGLEGWYGMLDQIRAGPHLLGQNDRGWTASFDWVLQPKNLTKIMEGNYANGPASGNNKPGSIDAEWAKVRAVFDEAKRRETGGNAAPGSADSGVVSRLREGTG